MTGLPAMSFKVDSAVSCVLRARVSFQTGRPESARNATTSPDENGATTRSPAAAGLAAERIRADSSNDWKFHFFSPVP